VNGFVLSLLPELGTRGSKWGEVRVTGLSTSWQKLAESGRPDAIFSGLSQRLKVAEADIHRDDIEE
jgi:hypothetical protein